LKPYRRFISSKSNPNDEDIVSWKTKITRNLLRASDTTIMKVFETLDGLNKDLSNPSRTSAHVLNGVVLAGRTITKDQLLKTAATCGKSGAFGAVMDGALGAGTAGRMYHAGVIDKSTMVRHVVQEATCGFVSSASGTLGTSTVVLITGTMGPAALLAGMGTSIGARYVYRQMVPTVLPDVEENDDDDDEDEQDLEDIINHLKR
jgi:hypothetical protein